MVLFFWRVMDTKFFNIMISDKNFINEDGTLAKTKHIARTSYLDNSTIIMFHYLDSDDFISIDFISKSKLIARFWSDSCIKEYLIKNNLEDSNFIHTSKEEFYSLFSQKYPIIRDWLIWNQL